MRLRKVFLLGFLPLLSSFGLGDLTSEYSLANGNPNGPWTYGIKASPTGVFTAFTTATYGAVLGPATLDAWGFNSGFTIPSVYKLTGGTLDGFNGGNGGVAIGQVSLHSGVSGESTVVRYTVGVSGFYDLTAYWGAGDGTSTQGKIDAQLYRNSNLLFGASDAAGDLNYSLSGIALTAGDTLDIQIGAGSDNFHYDTTPVNLVIATSPVPEPASLLGMMLGVGGICRRRRN